jgi:hypothetical protein
LAGQADLIRIPKDINIYTICYVFCIHEGYAFSTELTPNNIVYFQ